MEKELKKQIVHAAAAVKRKIKNMQNLNEYNNKVLETVFKPITEPLNQVIDASKPKRNRLKINTEFKSENNDELNSSADSNLNTTVVKCKSDEGLDNPLDHEIYSDEVDSDIDEYDQENQNKSNESNLSFASATEDITDASSWSLSSELHHDVPFGVRRERGKLMMGTERVAIQDNIIAVGSRKYKLTSGLRELLFKKVPDLSLLQQDDRNNYKQMLLDTNAHRRDYDINKPIKSNKGRKYLNVIKPLFKLRHDSVSTDGSTHQGSGLLKQLKSSVDYVYWNDPNELVDRLRLLIASQAAGNTGVNNEIISIIEELRESGIINQ